MGGRFFNKSLKAFNRQFLSLIDESSVNSSIIADGMSGGKRFEKKSFNAVATAFTGMSNSLMDTLGSKGSDKVLIMFIDLKSNMFIDTNPLQIFETINQHELYFQVLCKCLQSQGLLLQ